MRHFTSGLAAAVIAAMWLAPPPALAQNDAPAAVQDEAPPGEPVYKPPPRGAPGGRVGGASRGTIKVAVPLPRIDLLAPDGHTGLTTSATPILYFFVSRPITWPTRFTISAAAQPPPVLEVSIPTPREAGVYALRTADYHVHLEPGVLYTWSVSVILNPKAPSRDIVASASLLRTVPDPALEATLRTAPPSRRAAAFAQAGLWYDAVAAAAETATLDQHAALDALMNEVGLAEPARYDRQTAGVGRAR
ncbi:MAG TPA: DUF928 domain-containing protein [Stellaceae bacterium]|nr:DUF928 domain-containing protein [Stellaceae bacterium]